jgi:DNA-binding CsgD family transcriptional regulator
LKVDLKEKKTEAESVVKRLLASGMSADEILEKLK